jgi:Skp family chaperone for outer membrane proteins
VIDLEKVFRNYYKSRIAEETINQRGEAIRNYLAQLDGQLTALRQEANKWAMNATNLALTEADRTKAKNAAIEARKKVKAKETEIELFVTENRREIKALETGKRAEIMADIQREISRRATAEGYNFVIDRSGKTLNGQPAVLFYPAKNDITDSVLRELNRTAVKPKN